jgi:PTS system fructose-specific IIC component
MTKLLAVTSCPTGVAHTYMAAESLQKAAKSRGIELNVETRGAIGVEHENTAELIAGADAIIIAADTEVPTERFAGKPLIRVPVAQAIRNANGLLDQAIAAAKEQAERPAGAASTPAQAQKPPVASTERKGVYKHLMNGVSYMLPLVVAGGLLIAISFIWGIHAFEQKGTLPANLKLIGDAAFSMMVPILAGFIAYSIAEKPGLAPGLIGGMLAKELNAGFLGGIIAGFLAGYVIVALKNYIKMPRNLQGLKSILLLPLLGSLITGLLMTYVIGEPIQSLMTGLTKWLASIGTTNSILLGLLLGGMMAVDMGGPINKVAYTFGVGLLASNVTAPMAAVMAAGMTPPLGLWLATLIAPRKFSSVERDAGSSAAVLGLSFISEGAIPFAASDPLRVIPSLVAGSAVTGALSMLFNVTVLAPHGGIFVAFIPHAVGHPLLYALAIAIGTIVTALLVSFLKKPIETKGEVQS